MPPTHKLCRERRKEGEGDGEGEEEGEREWERERGRGREGGREKKCGGRRAEHERDIHTPVTGKNKAMEGRAQRLKFEGLLLWRV